MQQEQKKIGLVTFHNVYNYGGVLQAFALCHALKDQKIECINYIQEDLEVKYSHKVYHPKRSLLQNIKHFVRYFILKKGVIKEEKINSFIAKYIPLSKEVYRTTTDAEKFSCNYDILISGSDQIWNPQFTGGKLSPIYLLEFGQKISKRIAYASSAGAYKFSNEELINLTTSLSKYDHIGVREQFLKDQLDTKKTLDVKVVLDPTLLIKAEDWRSIQEPVSDLPNNFLLIYTFDDNMVCFESARKIADSMGIKVVFISNKKQGNKYVDITLSNVGVNEFVWLFDNAKFVVTNSFHGTTFSLIFRKNFYSIYKSNNPYRVLNLLSSLGLQDRLIKDISGVNIDLIDYDKASLKIEELRNDSLSFLMNAVIN